MNRPSWDQVWMSLAEKLAERSVDQKTKVGCVVVTDDNTQVLALGYNGDHRGGPNKRDSQEDGCSGFIHAEINALIKMDYNNPKRKIIYVTHSPCLTCAKSILNAGIQEIRFKNEFRDITGLELLKKQIIVKQVE